MMKSSVLTLFYDPFTVQQLILIYSYNGECLARNLPRIETLKAVLEDKIDNYNVNCVNLIGNENMLSKIIADIKEIKPDIKINICEEMDGFNL